MGLRRKPELDATKVPTAIDIAWSAGIFEGEGHPSNKFTKAAAVVTQKDTEILYRLRDWFGGSIRFATCKKRPIEANCHIWIACGDRARLFLALVYPFLSAWRKSQVDRTHALDFLEGQSPERMTLLQVQQKLDSRLPFCSKNDPEKAAKKKLQKHNNYLQRRLSPEYVEKIRKQSAAGNMKRRIQRMTAQAVQPERVM